MKRYLEEQGGKVVSLLSDEYKFEDELSVARYEAWGEGLSAGRAEGLSLGEEKGIFESAKRMKSKGFSDKDIADILDVSESKLKSI